jgi:hypothetical protein
MERSFQKNNIILQTTKVNYFSYDKEFIKRNQCLE